MPIIIGQALEGSGGIGYKNLFTETAGTVTVSTEDTAGGFYKENAYNWLGYDEWKPTATGASWLRVSFGSARLANYMAVWGHDLADHASQVKPQYSTDGAVWIDAAAEVIPADNNTLYFAWDDVNASHWRILVTSATTIPVIAGVQIGEALRLPHGVEVGFAPPSLVPIHEVKTARSELGVFIGGSTISRGIVGQLALDLLDPDWVRTEWIPFINHLQYPKPFVFSWNYETYATEVVLGWAKDRSRISPPVYSHAKFMSVALSFEGTP